MTAPAVPPTAAPAALIAAVVELPAATMPTALAMAPPAMDVPIAAFSALFLLKMRGKKSLLMHESFLNP
jgi:hypothetical protein